MVFTVMRKGCSLVRRIELTRLPLSLSVTFFLPLLFILHILHVKFNFVSQIMKTKPTRLLISFLKSKSFLSLYSPMFPSLF